MTELAQSNSSPGPVAVSLSLPQDRQTNNSKIVRSNTDRHLTASFLSVILLMVQTQAHLHSTTILGEPGSSKRDVVLYISNREEGRKEGHYLGDNKMTPACDRHPPIRDDTKILLVAPLGDYLFFRLWLHQKWRAPLGRFQTEARSQPVTLGLAGRTALSNTAVALAWICSGAFV